VHFEALRYDELVCVLDHLEYIDEGADRRVFGQNIIVARTASA
jgi:hypothetical protein